MFPRHRPGKKMDYDKIIRAPSLRRGKNDEQLCDRIKLKKVLGLTVCSNAALDVSPVSGLLAYPAGCTVVLFNAKKQSQSYLVNTSRKAITAVAFSQCGRYVATGESGINPAIKVWELDTANINGESTSGGSVVAEFLGHKNVITCVAFSPTGKYLVSVGSQHDMIVNVFDWKSNLKIASNKVSAKVSAVSFSEDGSYFVTVGNRHVKYWYLEGSRKYKEPIPLMGRSAILGELRNNDFCAVACGKGECVDSTYAITRVGHLVEFNSRRLLDKWVACRTTSANCISVNSSYILVGCAESIIRIFNAHTLEYITTLPRTHYLGVDVSQGIHINHIMAVPQNAKYPDTIAMVYDEARSKVTCVYNDHSLYIWDLRDIKRVGKSHSFLYHSTCIWGVETVPYNIDRPMSHTLPEDCFLTCSSDDTIRVWGLDDSVNNDVYRRNIYSKNLLKVMYIDDELNFIKDNENSASSNEKSSSYDGRNGVRCMKLSPEVSHLASGDRSGNIRIYNLVTVKLVATIEAHDSEVLCLEYTNEKIERRLLASASRDRLIHVFDVNNGYQILQTLDDHSSSITSIKFVGSGLAFQMISCGIDKSVMFRTFQGSEFQRGSNCSGRTTLFDMEVDSTGKHILTACQDRNIRVYGTQNGKHTKSFKGSHSDDGSLIKLCLDPSGIYIATSCTDKTLSVYDYYSNECMARMYGHSELATGLKFTNDCRHLISASGDGCIFIWQVPHDMIVTMQARLSQQRLRSGLPPLTRPLSANEMIPETPSKDREEDKFAMSPNRTFITEEPAMTPGYKFSDVGQLPQWAKRKATEDANNAPSSLSSSPSQMVGVPRARGRWAQRGQIESDVVDIRSNSESPLGPPFSGSSSNVQTSDYNSASSKDMYHQTYLSEDSSIDSGMETRREIAFLANNNRTVTEKKKTTSLRFEVNHDHDGDVEDISDGERTSSDHGMFYPNVSPGTPTEFKVNAMNEDELRKSMRRQKFEKVGLGLSASPHATSTGTGTSDTEDEGSTPSGENADRSLASTLGGSSEDLNDPNSSTFLQAALDGPGGFPERGDKTRRSISAKHNTENKPASITKSYTSTKKEELLKVINEAKQKLENVGYRSNLRGSQSISDLSHAANLDSSRLNRYSKTAPKAVLLQNCNVLRQLHNNYPPYPHKIGIYTLPNAQKPSNDTQPQSSTCPRAKAKQKPSNLDLTQSGGSNSLPKPRKSSILKNYKSCPVSPVHEEVDWRNLPRDNKNIIFTEPKRHSVYSEDAQTILDMIHTDTERMIDEITRKYGDLNDIPAPAAEVSLMHTSKSVPKNLGHMSRKKSQDSPNDEDGNFSSDSLENCSLDLDYDAKVHRKKKSVCKKHHKPKPLAKRSASDYFIYEEFLGSMHRNVSLSDILNDEEKSTVYAQHTDEANFLETQRHSSASFFLTSYPDKKSQESILSDDFGDPESYYNSMESILSDESDCKSAPLEMLFDKPKRIACRIPPHLQDTCSKSYGSSPNPTNSFDYYMHRGCHKPTTYQNFDVSGYTLDKIYDQHKSLTSSETYPRLSDCGPKSAASKDDIPTLSYKNAQYSSGMNKSLSKEFANHRQQNNCNPISNDDDYDDFLFEKKKVIPKTKPPVPAKPQNLDTKNMKKSCSFDVTTKSCSRTASVVRKFENNLEKFEKEKRQSMRTSASSNAIHTSCLKPESQVGTRRASSMRSRARPKISVRFNTVSQIKYTPREKRLRDEERFFEMYIAENGNERENNTAPLTVDLDLYEKPNLGDIRKSLKNCHNEQACQPNADFKDIEQKLSIIHKLIEMEEQKLEHMRSEKENRMKPFACNSKQKGYVKSLTMNFDNLARGIEKDIENEQKKQSHYLRMTRNVSLPDVLEGAKLKAFHFANNDDHESEKIRNEFGEKDTAGNPKGLVQIDETSIRRACSLSDLHMGKAPASKPNGQPTPQKTSVAHRPTAAARSASKRNSIQSAKPSQGMGSRSISVGVLNQASDSETDSSNVRGGSLRPVSSSQIRTNGPTASPRTYSSKAQNVPAIRRKGLQFSNTPGQDDSSSEETPGGVANHGNKPVVPPRPRNLNEVKKTVLNSPNVTKSRGTFEQIDFPSRDIDGPDSTPQLCSNIINMLNTTTNAVMQLHSRLKSSEDTSSAGNNNLMLKELENAVIMTQNMLTKITNNKNDKISHLSSTTSPYVTNDNSPNLENGDYLLMMNKCADMLSKVRSKHKSDDCEHDS